MLGLPPLLGYPDVGRSGLGNTLFPWARCLLWCRRHRVPMIAPLWFRIRVGPYLRRESDKRAYHRLFRTGGSVGGARRAAALLVLPRLPEPCRLSALPSGSGVVVFGGMSGLFEPLRGASALLGEELARITHPRFLPVNRSRPFVAVHVRLGDFSTPSSRRVLVAGGHNYRQPVAWYVEALRALRRAHGSAWHAVVYSDATGDELRPLIQEPGVTTVSRRAAITDILDMSGAAALIASGSTFSMWASFLGQIPTVWHPGQRRQFVLGVEDDPDLEPEWEAGTLPGSFGAAVAARLAPAASEPQ